jgi:hypothetical protein
MRLQVAGSTTHDLPEVLLVQTVPQQAQAHHAPALIDTRRADRRDGLRARSGGRSGLGKRALER